MSTTRAARDITDASSREGVNLPDLHEELTTECKTRVKNPSCIYQSYEDISTSGCLRGVLSRCFLLEGDFESASRRL